VNRTEDIRPILADDSIPILKRISRAAIFEMADKLELPVGHVLDVRIQTVAPKAVMAIQSEDVARCGIVWTATCQVRRLGMASTYVTIEFDGSLWDAAFERLVDSALAL
jgi:hypothetical protein